MLGGNNNSSLLPCLVDENGFQYQTNASNQLQLFGNVAVANNVDPVNYPGMERNSPVFRPNKRGREAEANFRLQRLQMSLNDNCHGDSDRLTIFPNRNLVSTGLRLSYDDEERNSSISSASGSMITAPSIMSALGGNITTELNRQKEEFDRYIMIQSEHMLRGIKDMKRRHTATFLGAIEKGVGQKLREKDLQIEAINRKNEELVERIKQLANESQNWQYRAKYNESVVNSLKMNLQQALAQGNGQMKEGFGDSDDAASCIGPFNSYISPCVPGMSTYAKDMMCKVCQVKQVSMLLMPCRHLCVCKDCESVMVACPVCHIAKAAGIDVYLA